MSLTVHPLLRNLTWSDFDPRCNCTWAGRLIGQTWRQTEGSMEKYEGHSFYYLSKFVKACAPVDLSYVSYGQILDWEIRLPLPESHEGTMISFADATRQHCLKDYCQNLQWEGNPDLSGIGVFTAYTFQASLTVFFILIHLYRGFRERTKASGLSQMPSESDRCLELFWVSSFYFGLGMTIATITVTFMGQASEHTVYFSFLGSLVSVSVLASLWPWYEPQCAHPHLAMTGMCILYLLVIIVSQAYASMRGHWETVFELHCFFQLPTRDRVFFLILTMRWIGWMIMAYAIFFHCLRVVFGWEFHRLKSVLRYVMSFAAFLLLWISLGYSVQLRSEISGFVDENYAENDWGFGQILAVVAWVPMVIEFLRIWAWGAMKTHVVPQLRKALHLQPPGDVSEETKFGIQMDEGIHTLGEGPATALPPRDNGRAEAEEDRPLIPAQEPLTSETAPSSNGQRL